jgi:hypothetical protein
MREVVEVVEVQVQQVLIVQVRLEVLEETVQIHTHHYSLSFHHPCLATGKRLQVVDTLRVVAVVVAGSRHKAYIR